ncbi:MAG: RplF, partial [uncultured bacterium]
MSRIGKKIRKIPQGVTVDLKGDQLVIKGPKGQLSLKLHPRVTVATADGQLTVSVISEENTKDKALWGTFSSIIENMLEGV